MNDTTKRMHPGAALAGLTFAVLGVLFLLNALGEVEFRFEVVLPVAAIVLGVGLLLTSLRRRE